MRLALAAGGVLLLALLTWLMLRSIDNNASGYAETLRAFDDFALAEASLGRDVLQARAGLLRNYDGLGKSEESMEEAVARMRSHAQADGLDAGPVDRLTAAVGQQEDLTERFKSDNSLLQNSLSYVSQLGAEPALNAPDAKLAPATGALVTAILHLTLDTSSAAETALEQAIDRFTARVPTDGSDVEAARALLAHARLLRDLLPELDRTLSALVAVPTRQPFEETRALFASAQAAVENTAQHFRLLLYLVSLLLLVMVVRLGLWLRTRTLALRQRVGRIRRLVDSNIIGIFIWDLEGRIIEANDAFLHMVGYDRGDLVSDRVRWIDLTPAEWRERDERALAELSSTRTFQPYEKEYFRKDTSRVPVLIGAALFEESGNEGVAFVLDLTERKCAEEALRESEAKFRDYAGTASDWLWEIGPDYKFTLLTENAFGSDPAGRIGTACWDHALDLETEPEKWRLVRATLESRKPFRDFVYCSMGGNGSPMYVRASGKPVFDTNGEFRGYRGTGTDVTAIMRAQHAEASLRRELQRSQFYLSEGQRLVHMGSWAFNPSGFFDHWSDELFQIYGLDPQKGNPTLEKYLIIVHPQDRDFMAETIKRMHAQRCGCDVKKRIIRPDGELRYIRCVGIPVIEDEVLKGFLGTAMDVTEQELLTQELERRQAYLAEAQKLTHTGSFVWDIGTGTAPYLSDEWYSIYGFQRGDEHAWKDRLERLHAGDRSKWEAAVDRAMAERSDYDLEERIVLPDGATKYLHALGHPVLNSSGEVVQFMGTVTDITERKRAEEESERLRQLEADLAHMNRLGMMGELAASLGHEITQPIASARNNARAALNFLDQHPPDLGEVREALGCVVGDADRAGNIVDRIREHIKKAPGRKERFDLNEAINEVIVLARSAIAENGVSVQTRLAEGLFPVQGDRVQLQQVVLNLILNAVEAMGSVEAGARELLISTQQNQTNGVLVAVRDSGPGIDPEQLERVFEAFYTTKSSGVGMGLSICRSIIDAHGGRLWAEANEPRGAVFQLTLPGVES